MWSKSILWPRVLLLFLWWSIGALGMPVNFPTLQSFIWAQEGTGNGKSRQWQWPAGPVRSRGPCPPWKVSTAGPERSKALSIMTIRPGQSQASLSTGRISPLESTEVWGIKAHDRQAWVGTLSAVASAPDTNIHYNSDLTKFWSFFLWNPHLDTSIERG